MNPYIRLPKVPVLRGRIELILEKCKGKRVLHLGCVDAGLVHERLRSGELMHQKLTEVASELWGIDINAKDVSFLRHQGFNNLIVGDICHLERIEILRGKEFDVIVASEVVEHLQNPGLFLDGVKSLMIPGKTELIITVPNAFRVDTLVRLFRRIEYVHPDHYYWFSYHTITNFLQKNGFEIEKVYVYFFQPLHLFKTSIRKLSPGKKVHKNGFERGKPTFPIALVRRVVNYVRSLPRSLTTAFLLRINPFFGDGIIIVARVNTHG